MSLFVMCAKRCETNTSGVRIRGEKVQRLFSGSVRSKITFLNYGRRYLWLYYDRGRLSRFFELIALASFTSTSRSLSGTRLPRVLSL